MQSSYCWIGGWIAQTKKSEIFSFYNGLITEVYPIIYIMVWIYFILNMMIVRKTNVFKLLTVMYYDNKMVHNVLFVIYIFWNIISFLDNNINMLLIFVSVIVFFLIIRVLILLINSNYTVPILLYTFPIPINVISHLKKTTKTYIKYVFNIILLL